jgi:hypothetical protein
MNKQIRELAEQAADGMLSYDAEGEWRLNQKEAEKFAQLIVEECLAQVDKVDAMLDDDKEKTGVAWVGLAIAKHFGVEQ